MRRTSTILVTLAVALASALAQTPALTAFEAVTIKPGESGMVRVSWGVTPTGYSAANVPLARVILDAYLPNLNPTSSTGLPLDRVKGAPAWVMNAPYDVTAKADAATIEAMKGMTRGPQMGTIAPMLRAMLEDRFKLAAHTMAVETQGYALVIGKHGIKMREAVPGEPMPKGAMDFGGAWKIKLLRGPDGKQSGQEFLNITMAELAASLGNNGAPVIDQTGLTARYNVELPLMSTDSPDGANGPETPPPDIAHRFDWEAVGLEMKPAKLPVSTVVIDHVERPTEN